MLILLRHATPIIDYSACNYKQALQQMEQYHQAENIALDDIEPFKQDILSLISCNQKALVYTSTSPRAIKTVHYLLDTLNLDIKQESIFSEFDLSIIKLPFIHLKLRHWFFLSRITWLLNLNKNKFTFKEEKIRAQHAARLIHHAHTEHPLIILVAHGFINRFIQKELKRLGWTVQDKKKNTGCFEMQLLKPPLKTLPCTK